MANVYKILSEYTSESEPDSISVSPYWVVAAVRFAAPLTFNREKLVKDQTEVSHDGSGDDLIKERPLIAITDDCVQFNIESNKGNYITSFSAMLASGRLNYLEELNPDDWILAWVLNSETEGLALLDKVLNSQDACNEFADGLKFVGRVQSVRKKLVQNPDGKRMVRYALQCAGFKELDAQIFFDPALAREEESLGDFLIRMGVGLSEVFDDTGASAGGLSSTKAIPRLLKLLVGEGIPTTAAQAGVGEGFQSIDFSKQLSSPSNFVQIGTGNTNTPESPFGYAVPRTVLRLLGQETESKRVPSYADILELVIGLQKYSGGGNDVASIFSPEGASGSSTNFRTLNDKLLGSFQPLPIAFSGKTVWSILEEFKNPAVNEMYTALRVNPSGRVVPTIIVRQLPFSTPYMMENGDSSSLTGMLEVPRWLCHPILINEIDIGKSDALHINFIHYYGQASAEAGVSLTEQIVQNPPIRDEQDIKRSGLRIHMGTVNCSIADTLDEPKKWMKVIADFLIGQQFVLTGTANLLGVSAPICPGDNFEFDDTVYHIESVAHSGSIDPEGKKRFSTALALSHGIRTDTPQDRPSATEKETADSIQEDSGTSGVDKNLVIYTGMKVTDNLGYDPGVTAESRNQDPTGKNQKLLPQQKTPQVQ